MNEETVPEANLDENSELPKILTILDDPKEVRKGCQKGMDVMKRTTTAGKRGHDGLIEKETDV